MTTDISLVFAVLGITILLFVTEWLRIDVIALVIMLLLGWLGLVTPTEAISGFASNAVIAMLAVMILGHGVDRSGAMAYFKRPLARIGSRGERPLVATVSAMVGIVSAFMQNIGATVLFLPTLLRFSRSTQVPVARLLMPIGFAAILGGTLTMVGSGPLIILNDLMRQNGETPFGLFSVAPVGLVLLAAGILYFALLGHRVLPPGQPASSADEVPVDLVSVWHLPETVYQCVIPPGSPLIGLTREESRLWTDYGLSLLAIILADEVSFAPWRHTRYEVGQDLILLGDLESVRRFTHDYRLICDEQQVDARVLQERLRAGFAEAIVLPRAPVAGKSIREIALRKTYAVEPIRLLSGERETRGEFGDEHLHPGDTLLVYGRWEGIRGLNDRRSFAVVSQIESPPPRSRHPLLAMLCFFGAIGLALSGVPLSLGLLSGAVAMVLLRVISIDDAYRAVEWRTVFLLAGLIPLGIAMEKTGAAVYIAQQTIHLLGGSHPIWLFGAIAILTTIFTLFMSNVAATVLLVPLVMALAQVADIDGRAAALLVAVCASNSFLLPTHQVNALLMAPGGYRNADYLRAGGIMTVAFTVIAVVMIFALY